MLNILHRRTTADKNTKKTIDAVGHSSKVTLTMREGSKTSQKKADNFEVGRRTVTRKPKMSHIQEVRTRACYIVSY